MHELVHRRLLALPPSSSPSSSPAPPAAAAAAGGWSLWKQRAPPQQQQGGSGGSGGGRGGAAGGTSAVVAAGGGRRPGDPDAGGGGGVAAAGAAAVGGMTWVVPIFLGFSLDLSIAWQHFPAAHSALALHLSPTSALHVAQALAQVLPGVQQAVVRALGRLKQQGAAGWEEELWGGKHVGGVVGVTGKVGAGGIAVAGSAATHRNSDTSTSSTSSGTDSNPDSSSSSHPSSSSLCSVPGLAVLRSAREILSLIRHTAALLRWLLQHRASLSLHLALPIILTTHRLARSAQLHAHSCARAAAAAGLSSPGWSEESQVAAEVAADFLLPEVTGGVAVGSVEQGSSSSGDSRASSSSRSSWFGGWSKRAPAPASTSTTIAPHPPPIPPPSDHDPLFTLLLSFAELQSEAATCLSAIIARREDSWHRLRKAACARLDGLARLFLVEQGVEGGGRGAAGGAGRGGAQSGSGGGDRRAVGDGGEGMAGMRWKDGADGSIGEWFQRLSWQVSGQMRGQGRLGQVSEGR
ncbi:unnamed protein product [Closterium sp. NIES-54]